MTELDDIRKILSDLYKYCNVIENCKTSHKSKVAFIKLLIRDSHLLRRKIRILEDRIEKTEK